MARRRRRDDDRSPLEELVFRVMSRQSFGTLVLDEIVMPITTITLHHRAGGDRSMSTAEYQRRYRASKGARTGRPGRPPADPTSLLPCGTLAAYRRHLRRGEIPDVACRAANAEHSRKHR